MVARLLPGRVRAFVPVPAAVEQLRDEQRILLSRIEGLEADLLDARIRGGRADDALAVLTETVARLDEELNEARRLSLRVAQLTDEVFDHLATSEPSQSGSV